MSDEHRSGRIFVDPDDGYPEPKEIHWHVGPTKVWIGDANPDGPPTVTATRFRITMDPLVPRDYLPLDSPTISRGCTRCHWPLTKIETEDGTQIVYCERCDCPTIPPTTE